MKTHYQCIALILSMMVGLSMVASTSGKAPGGQLAQQGQEYERQYSEMLDSLGKEIKEALPAIDEQKKAAFLEARAVVAALRPPAEDAAPL